MRLKANFCETFSEEAEKVIRCLVSKCILGFLYAHENEHFDNLFLTVLTVTSVLFLWPVKISQFKIY